MAVVASRRAARAAASPPEQLREHLAAAKAQHLPFDFAWKTCLSRVKWPDDKTRREDWLRATEQMRGVWEDAYYDIGSHIDMEALVAFMANPE